MTRLLSVGPISGEDTNALPVKEIAPAVAFYRTVLRFNVVSQDATTAVLSRDDVRIGLVRDPVHEPGKAGSVLSCYCNRIETTFAVASAVAKSSLPLLLKSPITIDCAPAPAV